MYVNTKEIGKKICPNKNRAIRPVLHSDEFPPLVFNGFVSFEDQIELEDERMEYEYKRADTESENSSTESQRATPQRFNQSELIDLVCDLDLSKLVVEILAFRLNKKHVLHNLAKVLHFKKREMSTSLLFLKRRSNLSTLTMYQDFVTN